jgi:internalin A
MPAGLDSRIWRKCLRLSVRGMILLVFVIGAGLGWMVRSARIQRAAVAAIERAGGTVGYDLGWTDDPGSGNRGSWAPAWLVDAVGVDYFVGIVDVTFSRSCSDRELALAGHLSRLEQLGLTGSRISDGGMVHLEALNHLSWIGLSSTQVTDAGLIHLKGLTHLSGLDLSGTQITDLGLAHLDRLTKLAKLDLSDTRVSDAGMARLKTLSTLEELNVTRTRVTEAGVNALEKALPRLTVFR